MVWDCLIGWVVVVLSMVGWSIGLVRSWTVPLSMLIATFIAQHIYVDLATFLVETLHLEPSFAIFVGYFFTWLALTQYCDIILSRIVKTDERKTPALALKIGGGLLGFSKGIAAFILSAMVAYSNNHVPEPPDVVWANRWIVKAAQDSFFLPRIHLVASRLDAPLGKFVLSDAAPRFKVNFALGDDPFAAQEKREEQRGKDLAKSWKRFQKDMDDAF